ncbi:S-layer homology domain-containing protein [Halomicronema sp. CCY15110]|uniref:S-layer homology domain-containing protein n=1 Tax=Halomicronema sp. CCY15110 TaxID=2767773 RepID=UPI001951A860|nr:S-layer homology domain-containing protein [Halomicronema sp. CCY15110]
MASSLTVRQLGILRPNHRETVFCQTLVVGNSVAAYTATLAILQAGGQVCWAQAGTSAGGEIWPRQSRSHPAESYFSWRLGRRISPWEAGTIMSESQQAFWTHWRSPSALHAASSSTSQSAPTAGAETARSQSKGGQFREAIAPYLQNQQLILIPQGLPIRVLYSQQRGQRRVHQVVFHDPTPHQQFQVHARLILDATTDARLQQDLVADAAAPLSPEHQLTVAEAIAHHRREARGYFFADSVALVMATGEPGGKPRPFSVPLRSLMLRNTEGFLTVSLPGCVPQLRPLFAHPRAQWALGEAAGQIAARAAQLGSIQALRQPTHWAWRLQQTLVRQGIPIFAFDDVALDDPDFEAIQMVAIADVVRTMRRRDLSFRPATPITKAVLASALARLPQSKVASPDDATALSDVTANHWAEQAIQTAISNHTLSPEPDTTFAPGKVLTKRQLWQVMQPLLPPAMTTPLYPLDDTPARRRHLSRSLYPILQSQLSE